MSDQMREREAWLAYAQEVKRMNDYLAGDWVPEMRECAADMQHSAWANLGRAMDGILFSRYGNLLDPDDSGLPTVDDLAGLFVDEPESSVALEGGARTIVPEGVPVSAGWCTLGSAGYATGLAISPAEVSLVPRSGLPHYLYVHAHHALRALRGAAERHPEDEGVAVAQERLSAILAGLKVRQPEMEGTDGSA